MKGEEFFGEVKEERLIDEDLSWTEFWGSVVVLGRCIYLYQVKTIRIESFWTRSYWLEVMGVFLIVGDLFFEEKTKKLLSYWEVENASRHPFAMFVTYLMVPVYIFGAVTFVTSYSGIATSGPFSEFLGGVSREQINELVFFTLLGVVIFSGPYYYVLEKRNDRILGTGVGLSVTGLTFATSAQITTAFF